MLKDLVKIANKLDRVGMTNEADQLDSLILKLSRDLASESEAKYQMANQQKYLPTSYDGSFEWPWEAWNSLSEATRADFYKTLDTIGLIPILGVGALSAKFTLQCFEGNMRDAAITLIFILLSFYMVKYFNRDISLLKPAGSIIKDIFNAIAQDIKFKNMVIDAGLSTLNYIVDKVISAFEQSSNFKQIAQYLRTEKQNLRGYLEEEINKKIT